MIMLSSCNSAWNTRPHHRSIREDLTLRRRTFLPIPTNAMSAYATSVTQPSSEPSRDLHRSDDVPPNPAFNRTRWYRADNVARVGGGAPVNFAC